MLAIAFYRSTGMFKQQNAIQKHYKKGYQLYIVEHTSYTTNLVIVA